MLSQVQTHPHALVHVLLSIISVFHYPNSLLTQNPLYVDVTTCLFVKNNNLPDEIPDRIRE